STATLSDNSRSPRPIVRAEAMAAFSTTRINFGARSLSIFLPKLRALLSARSNSSRTSVFICTSWRRPETDDLETIARIDAALASRMADQSVGKYIGVLQAILR